MSARCSARSRTTARSRAWARKALRPRRGESSSRSSRDPLQARGQAVPDRALARAKVATESAIKELEGARRDFADLLRKLQTSEDFIDELLQVRGTSARLDVIHQLTDGIRDASDKLKKLLGTIKTLGAMKVRFAGCVGCVPR